MNWDDLDETPGFSFLIEILVQQLQQIMQRTSTHQSMLAAYDKLFA